MTASNDCFVVVVQVVVENPWARINAQMPDPMARKRYKT